MKVLVVDDHLLFRDGLVSLFANRPEYQLVGEAGSVQEAIQKADLLKPDLILMDFNLPDGTGLDATRTILAKHPHIKIVFLTVDQNDKTLLSALRSGAKGFVLKNVSVSDLFSSLKALDSGEIAISPAMATRVVAELVKTSQHDSPAPTSLSQLSPREIDILTELASGASNQEIAQKLFISENTVKHHIHSLLQKLGINNRREAASFARANLLSSKKD
jgi:two-component system, NarL family, nitrate/nitrite response regulator NarL